MNQMSEKYYQIKVIPGAKENKIIEQTETFLKIKLKAPPQEGKANQALLDFLSKTLKIAKSNIIIISGLKSRNKKIKIRS